MRIGEDHVPTDETRQLVEELYCTGYSQQIIANRLDIDDDTLRSHYRNELDIAKQKNRIIAYREMKELVLSKSIKPNEKLKALETWMQYFCEMTAAKDKEQVKAFKEAEYLLDELRKSQQKLNS